MEKLKNLSKERAKHWENTIPGQGRKKLLEKGLRSKGEEKEKELLDAEYRKEEAERRAKAVERAKMLQYFGNDDVKNFHSKVLLYRVLEERDMQIALKKEKSNVRKMHNKKLEEEIEINRRKDLISEYKLQQNLKNLEKDTYAKNMEQIKEKARLVEKEREEDLQKKFELMNTDEKYKLEQKILKEKKLKEARIIQDELLKMEETKYHSNINSKKFELALEEDANNWTKRKLHQGRMMKAITQQRLEESMRRKELHKEELSNKAFLEEEYIANREKSARAKAEQREIQLLEEKEIKKKKEKAELLAYFEEHDEKVQNERMKKLEQKKKELLLEQQLAKEKIEEEKAEKLNNLKKGVELQDFYKTQIEYKVAKERMLKERKFNYDKQKELDKQEANEDLKTYINSFKKEEWVKGNKKLLHFIDDTLRTDKDLYEPSYSTIKQKYNVNTKERLGNITKKRD
ncbi:hypothetical protein HK099_008304 [Clydaea vesicula]|uniref:Trichohyalin-plectin-homology domain-containing protein n=1 Tax=Clydaea vesicula TaxID=447962 RepID=A0AAD5UB26_9FUNG|nr:hypothetical protein HK099_008304 [Clydaea vesicula]